MVNYIHFQTQNTHEYICYIRKRVLPIPFIYRTHFTVTKGVSPEVIQKCMDS